MIEILVRLHDGPGGRCAGDIVSVKELPHRGWGKEEGPPNYMVVKADIPMKTFVQYHKRHFIIEDSNGLWSCRSKYKLDLTQLSKDEKGGLVALTALSIPSKCVQNNMQYVSKTQVHL